MRDQQWGDGLLQTVNTGRMGGTVAHQGRTVAHQGRTVAHHHDKSARQIPTPVDAASAVGNLRSGSAVGLSRFTPRDKHGTERELLESPRC